MIDEMTQFRRKCNILSLLKAFPRLKLNYGHFMHKIEDARRMVGYTGVGGAFVSTWHQKLQDNSRSRKKLGTHISLSIMG